MPDAVGKLVVEIEAELDALVDAIVVRIRAEVPDFRRLPASTLAGAVRATSAARWPRSETCARRPRDELERAAAVGRERAEQGLTVDAVLHAYRISISAVWSRFGELARERGTNVTSVLAFSETLWLWGDAVMEVVGQAHREVELQLAREEQQRRDAFVLAVLLGTIDATELSRESAGYGLDPEREYVAFRARTLGGGGPPRRLTAVLTTALDRDLVGLSSGSVPALPGVVVGVGPPPGSPPSPAPWPRPAARFQTALAFGAGGNLRPRRPLDPPGDPLRRGARRRLHRPPPRAAGRARPARHRARGHPARLLRAGHADRGDGQGAARSPEHAAPPAAAVRGDDGHQPPAPRRPHRAVVGTRAAAARRKARPRPRYRQAWFQRSARRPRSRRARERLHRAAGAESSISACSRRSACSGRFALVTQWIAARR